MAQGPIVAVFGGSAVGPGDGEYQAAVEAGALLAQAGFAVATGGYAGIMEAAALGATDAGGSTIGFTAPPIFPGRTGANAHIDTEVPAATLTERIHMLVDSADGFLVMPGSIGTLTELMVVWNTAFVARYSGQPAKPLAAVGEPWRSLVPHIGDLLATDASLVGCYDDVGDAVAYLRAAIVR
jgi:uncharacterized protein (TIGR00730 family)